jgi:hypothetical protein
MADSKPQRRCLTTQQQHYTQHQLLVIINVETNCLVNHSVVLLLGVVWLMAGKTTGVPMSPW